VGPNIVTETTRLLFFFLASTVTAQGEPQFMRVAHPSVWFQKGNKSPRPPPSPDTDHLATPSFCPTNKGDPRRPSSSPSFRSLLSSSTVHHHRSSPTVTLTQDFTSHPFSLMAHAPLPVVSSHDSSEDEEDCPVCLEPLSFSFRLPGEKPHIVPECGHALHEVRFHPLTSLSILSSSLSSPIHGDLTPTLGDTLSLRSPSITLKISPFRSSFTCESILAYKMSEILYPIR